MAYAPVPYMRRNGPQRAQPHDRLPHLHGQGLRPHADRARQPAAVRNATRPLRKGTVSYDKKTVSTLDALWGTCDALYEVCEMLLDSKDARLKQAREGLNKAQELIIEMLENQSGQ